MENILIAEDDLSTLELIKGGLLKHNPDFYILGARNGQEAIDILKNHSISLLITDLKMPEKDGFEVLSYVHNHHSAIPCIVMTAIIETKKEFELYIKALQPDIKEMMKKESLFFFCKPININDLAKTVDQALENASLGGKLTGVSVGSFMQIIEMEEKTCCLEIKTQIEETGLIYFNQGVPVNASYGFLKGEEAIYEIINTEKAEIHIKNIPPDIKNIPKKINKNVTSLLLEAMKRQDEER